jgi:hypothetical protein
MWTKAKWKNNISMEDVRIQEGNEPELQLVRSVGVAKLHVTPSSCDVAMHILPISYEGLNSTRMAPWSVTKGTG